MSGKRYKAVKGSQTGHGCCFDASVVDTDKPAIDGDGNPYGDEKDCELVCECHELVTARKIAAALNAVEHQ